MATISPDAISLTTHHLHLCHTETDSVLSSASGFIFDHDDTSYLVTNWHNVSGRHQETNACLSTTLAVPDMLSTLFREKGRPGFAKREHIKLYHDAQMLQPAWYEHPVHANAVDVVAIPIPQDVREKYGLFPINQIDFNPEFPEHVADDAFVIGYPFSATPYLQLPIWKRASIASEPTVDLDQLPKMLVDTATRSGLSGSPVVMQRVGIHGMSGGVMKGTEIFGQIRNFIGVYSGRLGVDETKAQLGIVWKARVVREIVEGKKSGVAPHVV